MDHGVDRALVKSQGVPSYLVGSYHPLYPPSPHTILRL